MKRICNVILFALLSKVINPFICTRKWRTLFIYVYIYIYISRCLLLFFFFSCTRNDYTFMVLQLGSGFFLSADSIGRGEDPRFRERLSPSKFALSSLPSAYVHLFHARWNIEGKQLAYSIRGKEILVKFPSPWRNALRNLGLALHRKYW